MSPATPQRPPAACFHGLGRTGASMRPVRRRLLDAGYAEVFCPTYIYAAGFDATGAKAAADLRALSERHGGAPVDVVTHSMGGLLVRATLRHGAPVRRVVMLSPPNQGAALAANVRRLLPVHWLGWDPLGPLLPGAPSALPDPEHPVEVGILTGGKGDERGFSPFLDGDNDGKVRVEEARLDGARDFKVVGAHHTFMMGKADVLDLIEGFFASGSFG